MDVDSKLEIREGREDWSVWVGEECFMVLCWISKDKVECWLVKE